MLKVNDPAVQEILAFIETRFPEEFVIDRALLLERAAKILRIGDEYQGANANPRRLDGLAFVLDSASLVAE